MVDVDSAPGVGPADPSFEGLAPTNDAGRDTSTTIVWTSFSAEQDQTYAAAHPEWPFLAGTSATSPGSTCRRVIGRCGPARGSSPRSSVEPLSYGRGA